MRVPDRIPIAHEPGFRTDLIESDVSADLAQPHVGMEPDSLGFDPPSNGLHDT